MEKIGTALLLIIVPAVFGMSKEESRYPKTISAARQRDARDRELIDNYKPPIQFITYTEEGARIRARQLRWARSKQAIRRALNTYICCGKCCDEEADIEEATTGDCSLQPCTYRKARSSRYVS